MLKKILQNKAFTLIEMIVTTAIFSFVIVSITAMLSGSLKQNNILWDQLESQSDGRRVLREIVNTVRRAEESSLGSYSIVSASDYELIFYVNIDDDSLREKVRFWLDGTTLKRGIIKPSSDPISYNTTEEITEIAHYVVNIEELTPLFLYYDEDYTGEESPLESPVTITDIRAIKIQFEIEKDEEKTPIPLHLESLVHIRNLKDN